MTGTKGVAQGQGIPEGFGETSGRKACVCVGGWPLTSSPLAERRRKLSSYRIPWAEPASTLHTGKEGAAAVRRSETPMSLILGI